MFLNTDYLFLTICLDRYAFECDCTIVSYNYRVAPEARMPCCIYDCYAAIKWVIANADNLGIDKERIAIFGESGGGYVTAATAVYLADKGEGDLVKLQFPQLPMVNDMYFTDDWSAFSEVEKAQGPMTKCLGSLWVEDIEAHRSNPLVFPVKASVETVRKMPKAVSAFLWSLSQDVSSVHFHCDCIVSCKQETTTNTVTNTLLLTYSY